MTDVWLSATGSVRVLGDDSSVNDEGKCTDISGFPLSRASALDKLFLLIGSEITSISILANGRLEIGLDNKRVFVERDTESLEEVWAVMPDTPDPYAGHSWYVSLDDQGTLATKMRERGEGQ